ncbi:DUF6083 domain-containing protein [Streptomyces sp. NPDC088354]|uniref:DUF6083 domain-containing protein n=1 Tax=Streptomyces sp. NPDC088354 TaxID=3365856 RepID=UPI0038109E0E
MGSTGVDRHVCEQCGDASRLALRRGRIDLMATLCERCWNRYANEIAEAEGATAPPREEPDQDDTRWIEPPTCRACGLQVRRTPTNYDRWVDLGTVAVRAKDVPRRYRWRLLSIHPRSATVITDVIAVKVGAIEPTPGELIMPAHRALCPSPDAVREVERELAIDQLPRQREPGDDD